LEYSYNDKYKESLAKFSTLTDVDIKYSFDKLLNLSKDLSGVGCWCHKFDYFYGVNLSRALTQSICVNKGVKKYYVLSMGRAPTLLYNIFIHSEYVLYLNLISSMSMSLLNLSFEVSIVYFLLISSNILFIDEFL
jgi:hypothetical protein